MDVILNVPAMRDPAPVTMATSPENSKGLSNVIMSTMCSGERPMDSFGVSK